MSRNESDMSQPSKNMYMVGTGSSVDRNHTGLLQGPWIPRRGRLSSTNRKGILEKVMFVLSHEKVGGKEGVWNSQQREQPDSGCRVRNSLACPRKLKTWDYWSIKCETRNGTSEAENLYKGQNRKTFKPKGRSALS